MGKTDLGKWMITNGGEYSADATYEQLTMVKYGNSTYITLKTVTGITPVDDKINYQLMAQGFDATALSAVQAEDTQGLCGEKGEIVTAQSLVDALADKVMNTVMAKIGTAALTGGMTDLSSGVNSLYSNLTALKGINIQCANQSTVVGTDNVSVPDNTITDLYSFSLDPGIYILEFQTSWKSNAAGVRTMGIALSDTDVIAMNNMASSIVQPVDGDTTRQTIVYFTAPTSKVSYTVRAKQTSGSALTCRLRMGLMKLKEF